MIDRESVRVRNDGKGDGGHDESDHRTPCQVGAPSAWFRHVRRPGQGLITRHYRADRDRLMYGVSVDLAATRGYAAPAERQASSSRRPEAAQSRKYRLIRL